MALRIEQDTELRYIIDAWASQHALNFGLKEHWNDHLEIVPGDAHLRCSVATKPICDPRPYDTRPW